MIATVVPITPETPSSRSGLALASSRLPKPESAATMHQNEAVKVMCSARARAAAGSRSAPTRRQLAVRKTVCDRVRTKTMVAMLAVSRPIGTSSRWRIISVIRHAPTQDRSVPATGGTER